MQLTVVESAQQHQILEIRLTPMSPVTNVVRVHMVDLLTWLTGDRVIEVTAYGNRLATAGSKFDNFDLVVAILKFRSGMVGKIACNGGCVHPHFHLVNIYGTKATFINDLPTARLYYTRNPETPPQTIGAAYPGAAKGDMLASFVEELVNR